MRGPEIIKPKTYRSCRKPLEAKPVVCHNCGHVACLCALCSSEPLKTKKRGVK